jgi:hypothetical protein
MNKHKRIRIESGLTDEPESSSILLDVDTVVLADLVGAV